MGALPGGEGRDEEGEADSGGAVGQVSCPWGLSVPHSLCSPLQTAKSNLEKAVSEMAAASDEAAKAEAQIKVEANEALVKALE